MLPVGWKKWFLFTMRWMEEVVSVYLELDLIRLFIFVELDGKSGFRLP